MYGSYYMKGLANTYALDDGTKYPDSVEEAYQVLDLYSEKNGGGANTKKRSPCSEMKRQSHAQFNGRCRECGKKGHKATECPNANGDDTSIQTDSTASQSHHSTGSRRSAGRSTRSWRSSGYAWNA
eukprot:scaffold22605_cov192-Cylindrotheca_fusiformis.AAC.2